MTKRNRCGIGKKTEKVFSSKLRGFCLKLEVGSVESWGVVGREIPEVVVRQRIMW